MILTDPNPHGMDIVANIRHGGHQAAFRVDGAWTARTVRIAVKWSHLFT